MFEKKLFSPLKHGFLTVTLLGVMTLLGPNAYSQSPSGEGANTLTVRSDVQEANSETGVVTARGNVQINYPVQNLTATSAQAQYFRNERRLVLTGNVHVIQGENTIRAEKVTYILEEGRFVATPKEEQQVTSTYTVPEPQNNSPSSPQ